jgi:hypothetical protein
MAKAAGGKSGQHPHHQNRRRTNAPYTNRGTTREVLLNQPGSAPARPVSDFGSQTGAAIRPRIRSGAVTVATSSTVNCAYAACQ